MKFATHLFAAAAAGGLLMASVSGASAQGMQPGMGGGAGMEQQGGMQGSDMQSRSMSKKKMSRKKMSRSKMRQRGM